ncbi:MAG TPA: DUF4831 family protein [Candidatus Coprenecus pullistercoris]|nr:DUF4831 family protein [Candidatus Coprenecus pullistercoris]
MEKKNIMKLRILTTLALAGAMAVSASSQTVIYSLPSTTIHLEVKAVCTSYTPGPYASFAKKYLGIDVPQTESTEYTLSDIRLTPYIEADRSSSHVLNLEGMYKKISPLTFLEFSSQGLIILSDENKGHEHYWRFPTTAPGHDEAASEATSNLTSTETVLYRTERKADGGYEKVAFRQSQVVEKSIEKKAQEAASTILQLREQRINIITGNTDATFSGDALRAAVEEINRIEEQMTSLFTGYTDISVQAMSFDVVPEPGPDEDLVIAFRLSDTQGLLPADDISGRPVVMEITPEPVPVDTTAAETDAIRTDVRGSVFYRIPEICTVSLSDGQQLLLKSRMPIYQKGRELSFPVNILIKK